MKTEKAKLPTFSLANAGTLQDAWHYAMMIIKRGDSTFDGSYDYLPGIRGQVYAYENLLRVVDEMTADNETWELVINSWEGWKTPKTWQDLESNTHAIFNAVVAAADRLGIDARTGEKPETN